MIHELIKNETPTEQARIKSQKIAELGLSGEYTKDDYRIEIIGEVKHIEINGQHGIELFAKVWKNGKQLGFGDGAIETERFRIYNPPILVEDPTGTIDQIFVNQKTGTREVKKLKEDPQKATQEYLASIIKVVGKENTIIVKGSIGNTTSTFNPQTGEGGANESQDGYLGTDSAQSPWSTARESTSGKADYGSSGTSIRVLVGQESTVYYMTRSFVSFDTSALTGEDISSATFVVRTSVENTHTDSIVLGHTTLADPATITTTDWISIDGLTGNITANSDTQVPAAIGSDTTLTLNATGRANINKTGVSQFALVNYEHDALDSAPTGEQSVFFQSADAGGSFIPRLIVVHTTAVVDVNVNVSDSISITEDVTKLLTSFVNVSDSISITEDVTTISDLGGINVFDNISLSEDIAFSLTSFISVNDSLTINEYLASVFITNINVYDSISIDESLTWEWTSFININDSLTITENISCIFMELFASVVDSISINENISVSPECSINIFDSLAIEENILSTLTHNISTYESVSLSESIEILLISNINVNDAVSLAESSTVFVCDPITGYITMRSKQQEYPLGLTLKQEDYPIKLTSKQQKYPLTFDDGRTL